jgi:putative addiction module component (TIGR02574 family)
MDFIELKNEMLKLSLEKRGEMARDLLHSLDDPIYNLSEAEYEKVWRDEIERRIAASDRGKSKRYSREEALQILENHRTERNVIAVQNLDSAWNQAYQQKNVAALEKILSDDWMAYTIDQTRISKTEILKAVLTNPEAILEFDEFECTVFGQTAITKGRLTATSSDEVRQQRFMRVYQKQSDGWRAIAVQVVPISQ